MAWRPYENLIDGELDNRIPGKVAGWMRFHRHGKRPLRVSFDLAGDFHEDIRGKVIRLTNSEPSDRNQSLGREGTYMESFSSVQQGDVGDITAGLPLGPWDEERAQKLMAQNELHWDEIGLQGAEREQRRREFAARYRQHIKDGELYYPYVAYPYIEWYSERNGRVVLELEPSQVEIFEKGAALPKQKSPRELVDDEQRRNKAMAAFIAGRFKEFSRKSRKKGGDGSVFGAVIR